MITRLPRASRLVLRTLFAALLVASSTAAAEPGVRWRSGPALVPARTTAEVGGVLAAALAEGDGSHLVVQLERTADRATRQRLAAAGLRLQAPLGPGTAFASLDASRLDPVGLMGVPGFVGLAPVDPAWKRHPLLAGGATPAWSVVEPGSDPIVAAYVVVHRDVLPTAVGQRITAAGGRVMALVGSVRTLVVELRRSDLERWIADDDVQWVEPPLPRLSDVSVPFNDSNSVISQVDTVQAAPYGLDGSGVTVQVYDGGYARETHVDFGGRLTVRDSAGLSDHATHVAATIGGSGAASGGTFEGMAPGVQIESYGFEYDGAGVFLYTNPGDFEADYAQALNVHGAVLANNSIGTNTEPNGFPCNIQGDYGVMSSLIDAVVGGSLGAPQRVIWANGNERQGSSCDVEGFGDYYSTAPPATAKNHITVGALNSNDDSMTSFSSWGPTDDGRMKPDVSAPGCQSNGDGGVTSAGSASDTALALKCGTSMACPTATGCVALLMEDHRAQFGGSDLLPATVKVLLAHTAADGGNSGPDHQYGYGSIRIRDCIDFMRLGRFDEDELDDHGASAAYEASVSGGTGELRITLAWDDAPGTPNVLGALVNDLDLVVTAPDGTRHFPWTLDPANPGAPAVRNAPNRRDNLEQVLVSAPMAGTWRVEVRGHELPSGPQGFSICASEALTSATHVDIGFPAGLPESVSPATASSFDVRIATVGESLVGTPTLELSTGAGFVSSSLTALGGDLWRADLPPFVCSDAPAFYVSATGSASGSVTQPADAPTGTHTLDVQDVATLIAHDFESDAGWTTSNTAVDAGPWQRGVPADDGGRNDPLTDFDGSGACWITGNSADEDLDGGPTRLLSPALDLSGTSGEVVVRAALWMANNDFDIDTLDVEVSDDDGSNWTLVESLNNTSGWSLRSFRPADFVALTSVVRVRYTVTDNPNDSITEAAVDAFEVLEITCTSSPWLDLGHALAGVSGDPALTGSGPLTAGSSNAVDLADAAPSAPGLVFVSLSELPVPFKGGTLVTVPIETLLTITTTAGGGASLPFTMPGGLPSGLTLYVQAVVQDAAAVQGVAISNAVSGTAP